MSWAAKLYPFRGYLVVYSDGRYEIHRPVQGHISIITEHDNYHKIEGVPSESGVYKVTGTIWKGTYNVRTSKLVKSISSEAEKQKERSEGKRHAHTGAPGIGSNQRMADAATQALVNRRREAADLAKLLEALAAESGE